MRKKTAGKNPPTPQPGGTGMVVDFCTLNVDKIVSNASHIVKDH